MRFVRPAARPVPAATAGAALLNEGLEPGLRVTLDDQTDQTATICFVEPQAAYAHVRLEATGQRMRLESWRLGLIGDPA